WYRQLEQVQKGRKMMWVTPHFYKALGVDEEIAALDEEFKKTSITEKVLVFSQGTWLLISEDNPEYKYELLNMAENTSNEALYAYVEEAGYSFTKPSAATLDD